jgi:hypothetical protein
VGDGNALTVALWGVSDGRRTSVAKPKILKHAFTTDQADAQADAQLTIGNRGFSRFPCQGTG